MKNIISLLALVVFFSVGTAFTVSPAKSKPTNITFTNTCYSGSILNCHIAGLGNNEGVTVRVIGYVDCDQKETSKENLFFDKNFKFQSDKNGNLTFSEQIRPCPGGFNSHLTDITNILVYAGDKAKGTPLAESGHIDACPN